VVIGAAAAALLAYCVGLVFYSGQLPAPGEAGVLKQHVVLLVVATIVVSMLHVGAFVVAHKHPPKLFYVLVVGIAARLILLFGSPAPVLEGDRERLRFDGRLMNRGLNPYEFKPNQLADVGPSDALLPTDQLQRLQAARATLSASDAPRPELLRRPDLRTSATPLALWIASLADAFKPESSAGYAFLILVADVLAGFLLLLALRELRLPMGWLLFYAWCPVLLKEGYTTYSLDLFMMPAIAGLVYCIVARRRLLGALPLAVCIALRPAMILLLPVVGRKIGVLGVLLSLLLAILPFLTFQSADIPLSHYVEGQVHVWRHYEYNSALENVFRGVLRHVPYRAENTLSIAGVEIVSPDERFDVLLAKVCCIIVLLGVVAYTLIRVRPDPQRAASAPFEAVADTFMVLAAMLLVSPVLQPNHALWLLPILVVRPMGLAWFMLPGILSICYLTHLAGPDAADLMLAGGSISFRLLEYVVLGGFIVIDILWRRRLFYEPEDVARRRRSDISTQAGAELDIDAIHEDEHALV